MDLDAETAAQFRAVDAGGAILVRRAGTDLLDRGYGEADRTGARPNTPETAFQIASISKQFVAVAILLLQERGALSVRDRISSWVPDCPAAWEPITIHQLLTHTAGIPHWDAYDLDLHAPHPRAHLVRTFQHAPLSFAPGTGWQYSSPGYVLLAQIVERVTGDRYSAFLEANLFRPLGLASTGTGSGAPYPERRAVGYTAGVPARSFELDSAGVGTGDGWSTTADLARWDAALAAPGFLSAASLALMFAPHAVTTRSFPALPVIHYGYGWFIGTLAGHRLVYHTGDNPGFRALNLWLPDDETIVTVLVNERRLDPLAVGLRVASALVA